MMFTMMLLMMLMMMMLMMTMSRLTRLTATTVYAADGPPKWTAGKKDLVWTPPDPGLSSCHCPDAIPSA
ncbi:hypothetical protein ACLKA6_003712 [Drosophila palustris]